MQASAGYLSSARPRDTRRFAKQYRAPSSYVPADNNTATTTTGTRSKCPSWEDASFYIVVVFGSILLILLFPYLAPVLHFVLALVASLLGVVASLLHLLIGLLILTAGFLVFFFVPIPPCSWILGLMLVIIGLLVLF
jgi:hypothetical protein